MTLPVYALVPDWPAWVLLAAFVGACVVWWVRAFDLMRQGKLPMGDDE